MSLVHFALIFPLRIFIILVKTLFHSWFKLRWCPTSKSWLMHVDQKIRKHIKHRNNGHWVKIRLNHQTHEVWTMMVEGEKRNTVPIVLIHGITGGSNLFLNNIDSIAKHRDVYLIDLPGFGLSSKPELRIKYRDGWWVDTDQDDIETFYTQILENWFTKMRLNKVILLGHGFGAYISSVYCLFYPRRILHLVLTEPWGFCHRPPSADFRPFMVNKSIHLVSKLYAKLLIFTPIRALGPIALPLFRIFRLGIKEKFTAVWQGLDPETTSLDRIKQLMVAERLTYFPDMTMQDYCYLWMMNSKSGEVAYNRLSVPFGWARKPMEDRVQHWVDDLDVTFIFGSKSWVNSQVGWETKHHRHDNYVEVHEIGGAGHHVHADRPSAFNSIIQMIGDALDKGMKPNIVHDYKQRKKDMSKLRRKASSLSQPVLNTDGPSTVQSSQTLIEEPLTPEDNVGKAGENKGRVVFTLGEEPDEEKSATEENIENRETKNSEISEGNSEDNEGKVDSAGETKGEVTMKERDIKDTCENSREMEEVIEKEKYDDVEETLK